MATQQETPTKNGWLWRARAGYEVGTTRRQRQQQYRQQFNALIGIIAATLVISAIFVFANWSNVGAIKEISCAAFPDFCVPFAGQSDDYAQLEAEGVRVLDAESEGAPGVVRYVGSMNEPRIGNPNAPIHFVTVSDFACPHCQSYHAGDLPRFIEDYVLTGQATFGFSLGTWTGRSLSEAASQAALCAGEQGAFWEYSEEAFHAARTENISSAFSLGSLKKMARNMGLDADELEECLSSARYAPVLTEYQNFAYDNGVNGTPTVLVSYGNGWEIVDRTYGSLAQLTQAANAAE